MTSIFLDVGAGCVLYSKISSGYKGFGGFRLVSTAGVPSRKLGSFSQNFFTRKSSSKSANPQVYFALLNLELSESGCTLLEFYF